MKFASLLCAAALVLTTSAIADAAPAKKGAKAHKPRTHAVAQPAPRVADPYRAYWNDPSRYEFPSWGLTGR